VSGQSLRKYGLAGFACGCAVVLSSICSTSSIAGERLLLETLSSVPGFDKRIRQPMVTVRFTEASIRELAEFTSRNVGRPIEMRVDGRVYIRGVIREPILGGTTEITGLSSTQEASDLVARLSSGTTLEIEVMAN